MQKREENWPIYAAQLLRLISSLVRTKIVGWDQTQNHPNIAVAHWHGDELVLLPRFGHLGPTILVSNSRDGERMARAARFLGYRVRRGSSTRGAVGGLIALIRAVREGHHAVLAVDGPQGPRGVCKPGIVRLAQKTGVPLYPVGVAVSHKLVFKRTWNQAYLPLPFARQVILFGKPNYFPKASDALKMETLTRQVENSLHQAHEMAEKILHDW